MTTKGHILIRWFKKRISFPSTDNRSCSKLTIGELISAIRKIKHKGAAGPDCIPPTFLKGLGLIALGKFLNVFNVLFLYADCPRIWQVTTIIPILKTDRPACEVASYQPFSLTSFIVKLPKHILADVFFLHCWVQASIQPFQSSINCANGDERAHNKHTKRYSGARNSVHVNQSKTSK